MYCKIRHVEQGWRRKIPTFDNDHFFFVYLGDFEKQSKTYWLTEPQVLNSKNISWN